MFVKKWNQGLNEFFFSNHIYIRWMLILLCEWGEWQSGQKYWDVYHSGVHSEENRDVILQMHGVYLKAHKNSVSTS